MIQSNYKLIRYGICWANTKILDCEYSLIMARNWNKIWRYLHLSLGLLLVVYHARIAYYHQGMFGVTTLWSEETDKFISTTFIFLVMWTGLAKWPIYPWYKKRQNRKKREAKAEAAAEHTAEA